jgi:hypothetical protein
LIGPIFGFFAIDTQEQVKVIVHGAKAPDGDRKDLVQFFESLVDPIFPLETVLIGKQMGFPAASGNAVIPTTYGRIDQSAASFSHGKFSPRSNRFNEQSLPNCKTNATCYACPFLSFLRNIRFSPQNSPNSKTNATCCACPFLHPHPFLRPHVSPD